MKRVLCGRTPWSTKKQQRSADSWIDEWISDHGYESGNDMYGYPMIWTRDDNGNVVSAHKLEGYNRMCDEIAEALENSRSEKKFKEELDDIIDDHLGFVSDSEIAEMEGRNPFDDDDNDDDYTDTDDEASYIGNDKILCLDNYSEDEIQSMTNKELLKADNILYHGVLYYGCHSWLDVVDVKCEDAKIDIPVKTGCKLTINIPANKKFNKLTLSITNELDIVEIWRTGCAVLDLSKCKCDSLRFGSPETRDCRNMPNIKTIILPNSASSCRYIGFHEHCLENSNISNIVNGENITTISTNSFANCKNLRTISLSSKIYFHADSFENSGLSSVKWCGDVKRVIKNMAYGDYSHPRTSTLRETLTSFFQDTPYHDEFVSKYVDPFLEEIGE